MKKLLLLSVTVATLSAQAQNVNIPDANFKAYLVGNSVINTNGDSEIQISEATAFSGILNCTNMGISDLTGIEAFTSIVNLKCPNNSLTSLDVSANSSLIYLDCIFNSLTSLTLGTNTNLISVNFSWNNISSIDLSGLSALENLTCQDNDLTALDISNNLGLTSLSCNVNDIPSLDLSAHVNLSHVSAGSNALTLLNVANGNNSNFTFFGASSNPDLQCIQVDDIAYSTSNWTSIDAHTSFSEDCQLFMNVEDPEENQLNIYPNPTHGILQFSEPITDAVIYDITGKLVMTINTSVLKTDISQLENGVYILIVGTDFGTQSIKITKQ